MDKLQLATLGLLASVLMMSFTGLMTGRDTDTWKTAATATITGTFALLRGDKNGAS